MIKSANCSANGILESCVRDVDYGARLTTSVVAGL
jgi:hypothetical protein